MYQSDSKNKPAPKKNKVLLFFRDFIFGKFLIKKSMLKWYPYILLLFLITFAFIFNERIIFQKEERNRELQKKHDSIIVEFRKLNEIILTDDQNQLKEKAEQSGFTATQGNDYYKIYKENN